MLQILTFNSSNTYRPNDFKGMILPAADKAEWLIKVCLFKAGQSGHLDPDVFSRILE